MSRSEATVGPNRRLGESGSSPPAVLSAPTDVLIGLLSLVVLTQLV